MYSKDTGKDQMLMTMERALTSGQKAGFFFLGFLGGMLASNYDVKTVFIDAFLKLIKIDLADAKWFFDSLEKYAQKHDVTFVLSVSADPEALPDFCKGYII